MDALINHSTRAMPTKGVPALVAQSITRRGHDFPWHRTATDPTPYLRRCWSKVGLLGVLPHDQVASGRRPARDASVGRGGAQTQTQHAQALRLQGRPDPYGHRRAQPRAGGTLKPMWAAVGQALARRTTAAGRPDNGNASRQAGKVIATDIDTILSAFGKTSRDRRDAVLLCPASDTLARESELVRAAVEHLHFNRSAGRWTLWLLFSETNRLGAEADYRYVDAATMTRIHAWQTVAGITEGLLFRSIGGGRQDATHTARRRCGGADRHAAAARGGTNLSAPGHRYRPTLWPEHFRALGPRRYRQRSDQCRRHHRPDPARRRVAQRGNGAHLQAALPAPAVTPWPSCGKNSEPQRRREPLLDAR